MIYYTYTSKLLFLTKWCLPLSRQESSQQHTVFVALIKAGVTCNCIFIIISLSITPPYYNLSFPTSITVLDFYHTPTDRMNCKEHYLPELELATGQVREALQAILYTILL
jgi:hypothetical protein